MSLHRVAPPEWTQASQGDVNAVRFARAAASGESGRGVTIAHLAVVHSWQAEPG